MNGPGRFVRIHTPVDSDENLDHLLFQCLQTSVNIANICPRVFTKPSLNEHIMNIASQYLLYFLGLNIVFNFGFILVCCQELLRDDHEWVRLGALQFLKKYLSSIDAKAVALLASKKVDKEEKRFLYFNARQNVKMLCLDLVDQIIPGHLVLEEIINEVNIFIPTIITVSLKPKLYTDNQLLQSILWIILIIIIDLQVVENLLLLADILKYVHSKKVKNDMNELSLGWLLKNLNKLVYIEVSKHPQHHTVVNIVNFSFFSKTMAMIN